jgi:hypothetical protein
LLIYPSRTLPVLAKLGLAGWYYDLHRGSAIPMWMWRVIGFWTIAMALLMLARLLIRFIP